MGKIAIIGWGSLLWDLDDLEPHVTGDWDMDAGPAIPLEFSRVSPKRKLGLVVIIDPDHGTPCPCHTILSTKTDVQIARDDLARRERTGNDQIGWATPESGWSCDPRVTKLFSDWCKNEGWDGAVWTDLSPNFEEIRGIPFTIKNGIDYLDTLTGENAEEAWNYIKNAPAKTITPLRTALQGDYRGF